MSNCFDLYGFCLRKRLFNLFELENGLTGINQDFEIKHSMWIIAKRFIFISTLNWTKVDVDDDFFFSSIFSYLSWYTIFSHFSLSCRLVMNLTSRTVHLDSFVCFCALRLFFSFPLVLVCFISFFFMLFICTNL